MWSICSISPCVTIETITEKDHMTVSRMAGIISSAALRFVEVSPPHTQVLLRLKEKRKNLLKSRLHHRP